MNSKIGILIVNLGTPTQPTAKGVRDFLKAFLSDPRVIDLPAIPWQILLKTIILPLRCKRVAKNYQKIWTEQGSPLRVFSEELVRALQAQTQECCFSLGMTYGEPSIKHALLALKQKGVDKLLVLPLYPQYSSTTTASVFDAVTSAFSHCPNIPELRFVKDYHHHPLYIEALANQVNRHHDAKNHDAHLLISFHGLPERYCEKGDPYAQQCYQTATLLAEKLCLNKEQYSICFQSRFGRAKWLEPSTENVVKTLAKDGKKRLSIICPGFATDCLETLEEIAIGIKQLFLAQGGDSFMYIPALNDSKDQVLLMAALIKQNTQDWR